MSYRRSLNGGRTLTLKLNEARYVKNKLIFKLFLRNKSLIISCIGLSVLLVAYLLLYMATSSRNAYIYFAKDILKLSQIYFIAFLFLAYEFFYLSVSNTCQECIGSTWEGNGTFLRWQFLVPITLSTFLCLIIFICQTGFYLSCGYTNIDFIAHMGLNILLNFFLMSIIAMLFGCIISLMVRRLPAYLIIFAFIILTGPTFKNLFVNTKWYQICDFLDFYLYSDFMPNHGFGFSILPYRWARVLFWIFLFLSILLFQIRDHKKTFTRIISGVCVLTAILMVIVYVQPVSKVDMGDHYQLQEIEYYKKSHQQSERADFKILSYDISFDIKQILNADIKIYIDNKNLKEYGFTLYHGYQVQKIFDQNGNPLSFTQNGDYLTIKNNQELETSFFQIKYSGYSNIFYSNFQGIYLSGAFPYYPKAGFYPVYLDDLQAYAYTTPENVSIFRVKFTGGSDKIYSNLTKQVDGTFIGESDGATFLKGFYTTQNFNGVELIYPYLASELITEEAASDEIKNLIQSSIYSSSLKRVLSIPNMNNYGYAPVYSDYIEIVGITRLRELYETYFINEDKHWFYEVYNYFINDRDQFRSILKSELESGYEYEVLANPLELAINHMGKEKVINAIERYLYDSKDTRSPSEFLNDLINEKRVV